MQMHAWVALRDWSGSVSTAQVYAALRTAGITDAGAEPSAATHGVLLFGEVTPALIIDLHELSRGGRQPVLAVVAAANALADGVVWQLLAAGAADVLAWDGSQHPASDIAARLERWLVVEDLQHTQEVRDTLIGDSQVWQSTLRQVAEASHFTTAPVLITGESGTGKELVARMIHALDPRPDRGEFVVLDCTTVVPTLSGSEFFGHEKGAFTGAVAARDGAFALADQGTLFLDEISELQLPLQVRLLVRHQTDVDTRASSSWHGRHVVCWIGVPALQRGGRQRRSNDGPLQQAEPRLAPTFQRTGLGQDLVVGESRTGEVKAAGRPDWPDPTVEVRQHHPAAAVVQPANEDRQHVRGALQRATEVPGMQVVGGGVNDEIDTQQAAQGVGDSGSAGARAARIGHQRGVRRKQIWSPRDQVTQCLATDLLFAFEDARDIQRQRPGGGQVGFECKDQREERPLVVGGAPTNQIVSVESRLERGCMPRRQIAGGLDVVVSVHQERGAAGQLVPGRAYQRLARAWHHVSVRESQAAQTLNEPIGAPPHVDGVPCIRAHRGYPREVSELVDQMTKPYL
jgi:hypothetical protein